MKPAAPVTTKYIPRFSRSALRQGVAELFGLHDGGAELENLDAGCDVRDSNRLVERRPRREHHPQRRDDRVPGAADIEHLARSGLFVEHTTRLIELHPVLAESHQQRLQLELLSQRLSLARKFFFGFPTTRNLAELGAVGRHDGRA